MKLLKTTVGRIVVSLGAALGLSLAANAQYCGITFNPNPGTGVVDIESYWIINGPGTSGYTSPLNPALFRDTVLVGNSTVPAGTYNGWCIDVTDSIDDGPETYNVYMLSSCDPNIDIELADLGYTNHFTYPATDTNGTAGQWKQLNYLLNHTASGATYWDVQATIWDIIGGPLPPNSVFTSIFGPAFPDYDTNLVSEMYNNAVSNAPAWQPECGDVISVVLAVTTKDATGDFPLQLTVMEVPYPCMPCIGVSKEIACLQPTNNCGVFGKTAAGYSAGSCTGVDAPAFCYQIIITNCGSIPLTNVIVSDSLLGTLTNFFTNTSEVFAPGASMTNLYSMPVPVTTTNVVTVFGQAALTNAVTNLQTGAVTTNGQMVSATDSAVAQVAQASMSCNLELSSPANLNGSTSNNIIVLPSATYSSMPATVTLAIQVCNTGLAPLNNVTIKIPALTSFNCSAPAPFNLAVGQCQTFQLCIGNVQCPANISLNMSVTGTVAADAAHCGVYDITSTNLVTACTFCNGMITCTNCAANVSGSVLLDCSNSLSTGLPGIPVSLFGAANNLLAATTTAANGSYSFIGVAPGTYSIGVTPPSGFSETYPVTNGNNKVTFAVVGCASVTNILFGYADNNLPVIIVPPGTNYGCDPTHVASISNILAGTTATEAGSAVPVSATEVTTTNSSTLQVTEIFTVTATGPCGTVARAFVTNTWMICLPSVSCASVTGVEGQAITPVALAATGGAGGPYTFTATNLPPDLTITTNGIIMGTPIVSGTFNYTVFVTDIQGNKGSNNCSVTIGASCPCSPENIQYNFNGTQIIFQSTPGGSYVWFLADGVVQGLPSTSVLLHIYDQSITIPATGSSPQYTVPVPDSYVTFSPSIKVSSATFNTSSNVWLISQPTSGLAGNVLYGAAAFKVPAAGLPGGIQNVNWSGKFATATSGLKIQWQWHAAAYSNFTSNYVSIAPKPCDDNKASVYQTSDQSGTPEGTDPVSGKLWKTFVEGGAAGGGGGNYTGSGSSTIGFPPCVCPNP